MQSRQSTRKENSFDHALPFDCTDLLSVQQFDHRENQNTIEPADRAKGSEAFFCQSQSFQEAVVSDPILVVPWTLMRRYDRQDLYNRVWKMPMSRVARDVGFSDDALRSLCAKHREWRSRRTRRIFGYWTTTTTGGDAWWMNWKISARVIKGVAWHGYMGKGAIYKIFLAQVNIQSAAILVHMFRIAGPRNRNQSVATDYPCQCHLCGCHVVPLSHRADCRILQ